MARFRGLLNSAVFVLATTLSVAAQPPSHGTSPPAYIPRHERVAASILRRRQSQTTAPTAGATTLGIHDVVDDAPPPPPAMFTGTQEAEELAPAAKGTRRKASPVQGYPAPLVQDAACGPDDCSTGQAVCDTGCGGCDVCRPYCWMDSLSIWGGVQGFKGPFSLGQDSSFGFQEGFNWGSPWVFTPLGMNTQVGFRGTQSNFNGAAFTTDHRAQFFVTAGIFRRAEWGWQGGVVFDYLHEDWYTTLDVGQIRGEISWAVPNGSSFGLWFASSVIEDTGGFPPTVAADQTWETHDIYAAFYRATSSCFRMGQWRVFAGFTAESDGIIGSDFKIPLAGTWSLEPEFTYLIPDEATGAGGNEEEAWNVAFNLVWYPGRALHGIDYTRLPLLDVAGNGSMILRQQ